MAEEKYRVAAMAAQESTWLIQLLKDLHQPMKYAILLYCDNYLATRLVGNPVFHASTKYVELHYHFPREKVFEEAVEMVQVIKKENQVADVLTKRLSSTTIRNFYRQLSIIERKETRVEGEC